MTPSSFVTKLSVIDHAFDRAANGIYAEWVDDPPAPVSALIGAMGHVIRDHIDRFNEEMLMRIFELVEEGLLQGGEQAKDGVATSLLENLQNYSSAGSFDFRKISRFLGDESRSCCIAWDKFTGVTTQGLQES